TGGAGLCPASRVVLSMPPLVQRACQPGTASLPNRNQSIDSKGKMTFPEPKLRRHRFVISPNFPIL
ncbi:hypothetical protein, partial [Ralstonia pseudosolanacearum]|uniref:hypothetical protein n=1 Tax=Ralstonia pseudosolanacearum TaxID=1310165 RepID=UPI0032220B31